jgi:antitoxin component YwqK of YwqJK toxin-antitoxin module
VNAYIDAYYEGCSVKVIDSIFEPKHLPEKGKQLVLFYDKGLMLRLAEFKNRNDTVAQIFYYRNGQKRKEDWFVAGYKWIYTGRWCENGQTQNESDRTDYSFKRFTLRYCNGNLKWEAFLWNGRAWGVVTTWYESGQKKSQEHYTEFNQVLADKDSLKNELIGPNYYWNEKGEKIDGQIAIRKMNTWGFPLHDFPKNYYWSESNGRVDKIEKQFNIVGIEKYSKIKGMKEYDGTMSLFQEKVYSIARKPKACGCKVGQVNIVFVVTKEGNIKNIQIADSLVKSVDDAFVEAIRKINKWTPAKKGSEFVDVAVEVALSLENIKQ